MIPSSAPLVFTGLVDQLRLRAAFAGVQVASVPLAKATAKESFQLFGTQPADEEWSALGHFAKDETYEIVAGLYVQKAAPSAVADTQEETGRDVRDRAYALLGDLATFLRGDPHMTVITAGAVEGVIALLASDLTQGVNTDGRWCEIDVRIGVRARLRT